MAIARITRISRAITLLITIFSLSLPAYAKYSGGTGEPNDPYRIATAADLIALGETLEDYDKHFILTADIDLEPNLPSRKVFDKAVIAPSADANNLYFPFQGTPFTGVFDGTGHMISHLVISGSGHIGLFGKLESPAEVKDLGVVDVKIVGLGAYFGGLTGTNGGTVNQCYSTGTVSGDSLIGGLVGTNWGVLTGCYNTDTVYGGFSVGGLVGHNMNTVSQSYSTGPVRGDSEVGGLVGKNGHGRSGGGAGFVARSYCTGAVNGTDRVGGLVGANIGIVIECYSSGALSGTDYVGGLVGENWSIIGLESLVISSFWDIETSGQPTSADGTGKTTSEMQTAKTFLDAGWDFVDETANGTADIWWMLEGQDYPRLWWELIPES